MHEIKSYAQFAREVKNASLLEYGKYFRREVRDFLRGKFPSLEFAFTRGEQQSGLLVTWLPRSILEASDVLIQEDHTFITEITLILFKDSRHVKEHGSIIIPIKVTDGKFILPLYYTMTENKIADEIAYFVANGNS